MNHTIKLAIALSIWLPCAQMVRSQEFEIVPLPKTTIEFTTITDGKVQKQETKNIVGTFQLPFNANPDLRGESPPFGHREEISKERITVLGKEVMTKRIDWILKEPDAVANFNAQRITFWVSDQISAPEFLFPIPNGPGLPLPSGTVRFEHLPREKDSRNEGRRKITVSGKLTAENDVTFGSEKIAMYVLTAETKSNEGTMQSELWLSSQVPGTMYKANVQMAGPKTVTIKMQVKEVGRETPPKGLHQVDSGEFAVGIPKGWKISKPKSSNEALRLVPQTADDSLNRAITVEIKPAAGKSSRKWAHELHDQKIHGLSFDMIHGMADTPTFTIHYWRSSAERVTTYMIGSVYQDRLYLIAHSQDRAKERSFAGSELVEEMVQSWRWLREKQK
jgi:hypothetical protein